MNRFSEKLSLIKMKSGSRKSEGFYNYWRNKISSWNNSTKKTLGSNVITGEFYQTITEQIIPTY